MLQKWHASLFRINNWRKIPENNCAWEIFLLLKQIISIVTSRTIHESTPKLLKSLIEEHHSSYLKVFINVNLKPKHHIITHYPEIMTVVGPLINISSMRFEAKHRDFKKNATVVNSRVNITSTLTKKHQLQLCERFFSKRGLSDKVTFGPYLDGSTDSTRYLWIEINGIKYVAHTTVLLCAVDEILPEFGLIVSILSYEDKRITFILQKLFTVGYYSHIDAYTVIRNSTHENVEIDFSSLIDVFPTSGILSYGNTNDSFVCFR